MTVHCGTPACISPGVDISPSTVTLNFLLARNELICFVILAENCSFDTLYSKPGYHVVSKAFFDVQEYRSRGYTVVEVQGHVVRKPPTLKCRAMTCTKAKLTCI